jgi:hypothetical protein
MNELTQCHVKIKEDNKKDKEYKNAHIAVEKAPKTSKSLEWKICWFLTKNSRYGEESYAVYRHSNT